LFAGGDGGKVKKLLAIVDDWEKLEVYEDRLKMHFEVSCAPFGHYGIEMAREMLAAGNPPDVILVDLVFEDMDEFEAESLLLKDSALAGIFRILITDCTSMEKAKGKRLEHPKSHLIPRPYQFDEFVRILQASGS
jgi:CheY-like chemotaxis protein